MGESFTAQLTTGGAAFTIPLATPTVRGAAKTTLSLVYSSTSGFGLAGAGWSLGGAGFIARQTDRGIPRYDDRSDWHAEQDRFIFGGQELVPICRVSAGQCSGARAGEAMPVWADGWQYFRARVEGAFLRFFWSPDHLTWRIQSKQGVELELGRPLDGSGYDLALERNPDKPTEIYRWHVVRQYDSHGAPNATPPRPNNLVQFRYIQDAGVAYLTDVFATPPAADPNDPDLGKYAHHTGLRYDFRPDPQTSYRSGWLLELRLRLAGADVATKPFAAPVTAPRELVRRYHLAYDSEAHTSLLTELALEGRCESAITENANQSFSATSCPRLPPISLEYARVDGDFAPLADSQGLLFEPFDGAVLEVENSPSRSLDAARTRLADVNSDGLPDVLVTEPGTFAGRHGVFFNRGTRGGTLTFGAVEGMTVTGVDGVDANVLSFDNPNVAALDVDADARIDLVHMPMVKRYSIFSPEKVGSTWRWTGREVRTASGQDVKINFTQDARRTAVMDVNGDGLVDVVFASATEYQTFFSLGRYPGGDGQFGHARWTGADSAELANDPVRACTPWSGEAARLGDADVRVADLNGDQLPDIVRIRSGQITFWPGRGNGFWGTGSREDCSAGSFGQERHVQMANAPRFGTSQPGTLALADVNADGYADLVEIRANAVDIYLNDNGAVWTERQTLSNVPFQQNGRTIAQLADFNGSGSADIVWGQGHEYRYVDLTGGIRPYLLTKVHNGLGRTAKFDYASSTELMVKAEVDGAPWASVMPLSMAVVVRSTASDNLDKVGRVLGSYVTEYSYRDPVFDGRQREFRGFRSAETRQVGDANSPTRVERSVHLLGECQVAQNSLDVCAPEARWKDNWRESLKGLPSIAESSDETGTYLSTTHHRYELRQLYTGRDGRRVSVAYGVGQETFKYDNAPFEPAESSVSIPSLDVRLDGIQQSESAAVPKRATRGTARLRAATTFDDFGNKLTGTAFGCVEGCSTSDEVITATSTYGRPEGEQSGWLWRSTGGFVTGSVHTGPRNETRVEYNTAGDPIRLRVTLSGTLPLDRFHEVSGANVAPSPPGASSGVGAPVDILVSESTPDAFGTAVAARGALNRCRSLVFDSAYAQLPVSETVFGGPLDGTGCGARAFTTTAVYDRGLSLVTDHTSPTGQPARFQFDGFGRLVASTYPDPDRPGQLADVPTITYQYILPARADIIPYSITISRVQDGANRNLPEYFHAYHYMDGMGRTLIILGEADPSNGDGGQFIAGGETDFDAKATPVRSYLGRFWSGDPLLYPLHLRPGTGFSSQQFDAFGRSRASYSFDGEAKVVNYYHALGADAWDAEDLRPGPHRGTFGSIRTDGHGRPVESTERVRHRGAIEERKTLSEYLPTGEPLRVTTRRAGSPDVVRWMRYDSLGRLVLNAEPNTSTGFTPDFATDPDSIKAWRYAYNDLGEMVGTSDARGCGINYHRDTAGRLVAEDLSPCRSHHAPYTPPDLGTGNGTEVFHRYDLPDPDGGNVADAGGNTLVINGSLLWGRHVSVSDRGTKGLLAYDALGRQIGSAVKMIRPGPQAASLSSRYAPRWYIKKTQYDAADRAVATTTGATTQELSGSDGTSRVTHEYTRRGVVKSGSSSYGVLLASQRIDANGLVESRVLGDAASTTSSLTYDQELRLKSVQTYRSLPGLWSSPPSGYSAPMSAVTAQLLLEDSDIEYDGANNITKITDWRIPTEWPSAAKPVTRTFEYDDLYRLTRTSYSYADGVDTWASPFAPENASESSEPKPSPHVSFQGRVLEQRYEYDHLGNTSTTTDNENGFFDRSLGRTSHGTTTAGPHQVRSASNRSTAPTSSRKGDLEAAYDASGSMTDLVVRRDGPCLPQGASCWQRFLYEWDEIGQMSRARRYDLVGGERTANDQPSDPLPNRAADVELRYAYDGGGQRVLKTAVDSNAVERHAVYVSSELELRRTSFAGTGDQADYELNGATEVVYLSGGGVRARVVHSNEDLPALQSGGQHLFLEMGDHLGSTSFVIDHATGELVEYTTYQAYGQTDSDYRPARWGEFRESYKFSGKEEDVEVGLAYFGSRYLSLGLGRWTSADPAAIHKGRSDPNPYAYVKGRPIIAVDPNGEELLTAIVIGVVVGAIISGGVSAGTQWAQTGHFGGINWGWDNGGVLFSMAVGGVAGGVSAGVGSLVSGAITGAVSGPAGAMAAAVGGGVTSGAAGGAASYLASAAFTGNLGNMTWGGFGSSVGTGTAYGGAFGALNAAAVGFAAWDASIGKPDTIRDSITPGALAESLVVGAGQGAVSHFFLKAIGAPDAIVQIGTASGMVNGLVAGAAGTYNWESPTGWVAAGLDSTVGLTGTTLGNLANVLNFAGGTYDASMSYRQNRMVFRGGLIDVWGGVDARTAGSSISAKQSAGRSFINMHETVHVWQQRLLGPVQHLGTIAVEVGGRMVGYSYGMLAGNFEASGYTAGYMNSPFEYYAYTSHGRWPPRGAVPGMLAW